MTEKAAKWIFWVGTLVSLALFLGLTVDTHRQFGALTHADRIDDEVVAGKRAFERHNCNDCHTILGFGGYYAPDLTRVYTRLGSDAIRRRLKEPEVAFADSFRKMPQQNLKEEEIENLVSYFEWVSGIENHDWPPQHSEDRWKRSTERVLKAAALSPAAALVLEGDCLACHTLGDRGEKVGGRLEWIVSGHDAAYIAAYLKDPQAVSPGVEMPAYDQWSDGQRLMIGEFLLSLQRTGGER